MQQKVKHVNQCSSNENLCVLIIRIVTLTGVVRCEEIQAMQVQLFLQLAAVEPLPHSPKRQAVKYLQEFRERGQTYGRQGLTIESARRASWMLSVTTCVLDEMRLQLYLFKYHTFICPGIIASVSIL